MEHFLKELDFKSSAAKSCFFLGEKYGKKLILELYIDDGLVAASDKEFLKDFRNSLKSEFKIVSKDWNRNLKQ